MQKVKKKSKNKNLKAPRFLKHRKWHKFFVEKLNYSKGGSQLEQGYYGLRLLKSCRLDWKQIEAARQKISRLLKKKSQIHIRVFPQIPLTEKPKEVRMGKGKGAVSHYIIRASAGTILFEIEDVGFDVASLAFNAASKRLPGPTVMVQQNKALVHQVLQ